ncbi:hypothetical protein HD806DRAFT_325529 [Xylariaceae sp. AK1471]|nr:hypothetical protein HD806DRAFT_325529 [Xylariaceae sp. AK1471]
MSSSDPSQLAGSSIRTPLACEYCRKRKSKCDGRKPTCLTCKMRNVTCSYGTTRLARREKYWDRDYVQSLEEQVDSLSRTLQIWQTDHSSVSSQVEPQSAARTEPSSHIFDLKTSRALRDFSSLNWAAPSSSRGVLPIFTGPGHFSVLSHMVLPIFEEDANCTFPLKSSPEIASFAADIKSNIQLKKLLKEHFLKNINIYYNFVDPSCLSFSDLFPHNDTVLQFLYSAMFAATAYNMPLVPRDIANGFMAYAESLVQECCHDHLCLLVIQALLILAWNKHIVYETMKGNLYQHMATGLSTHLDIRHAHQLSGTPNELPTIRTFWSLYLVERTSTAKLGCSPVIPWDVYQVACYLTVVPPEAVDISAVAFEYHCRLLKLQQEFVDPLYSSDFQLLQPSEKHVSAAKANNAIISFRKQIDKSLYLGANSQAHTAQVVFWICYHSLIINVHRPLLNPDIADMGRNDLLYLHAATSAANSTTRLLKILRSNGEVRNIPPFAGVCIMRAALVHALSMTFVESGDERQAKGNFWICLWALGEFSQSWPHLGNALMPFLIQTAQSWGIEV